MSNKNEKTKIIDPLIKSEIKTAYISGKAVKDLVVEFGIAKRTIYNWIERENWDEQKNVLHEISVKYKESINYLMDPKNEAEAIASGNLDGLLRIQGMHIARLQVMMASDQPILGLSETIQKYITAVEKGINALIKLKEKGSGDGSKVVRHFHYNMDEALKLVLEARKQGVKMTVDDAAKVIEEQAKKAEKDDK